MRRAARILKENQIGPISRDCDAKWSKPAQIFSGTSDQAMLRRNN
jgi:hypothetical protein